MKSNDERLLLLMFSRLPPLCCPENTMLSPTFDRRIRDPAFITTRRRITLDTPAERLSKTAEDRRSHCGTRPAQPRICVFQEASSCRNRG